MATKTKEISAVEAISAYGPARSTITGTPLSPGELDKIDAYWRASLYLCVVCFTSKTTHYSRNR